eukprot:220895-Chlamydomonas_euryale.AAC.1
MWFSSSYACALGQVHRSGECTASLHLVASHRRLSLTLATTCRSLTDHGLQSASTACPATCVFAAACVYYNNCSSLTGSASQVDPTGSLPSYPNARITNSGKRKAKGRKGRRERCDHDKKGERPGSKEMSAK